MKIHYLQHVPFEGLASIESWVMNHHHALSGTRFYANDLIPPIDEIDWLIVMGGPMNIHEEAKYPWLNTEKWLIERAIKQHKIVIGICLGAQLIANVLGAKVYRGQHQEVGWFPIVKTAEAEQCPLFTSLPQTFNVFHWHSDTFDLPQGATQLAYSKGCQHQAFVYNDNVLGLQFHLESTRESVKQIIENCADELIAGEYVQTPEEMLSSEAQFNAIHTEMNSILNRFENCCVPQSTVIGKI